MSQALNISTLRNDQRKIIAGDIDAFLENQGTITHCEPKKKAKLSKYKSKLSVQQAEYVQFVEKCSGDA